MELAKDQEPVIVAEGLAKTFEVADKGPGLAGAVRHLFARKMKRVEAVKGATLEVGAGEVVGFLGPNGAGKTTTLKMLTGLIHPSGGTCRVAGHVPFKRHKDFLRRITLVMGNKQQLIWDLPARDSLRIQTTVYEIEPDEAERRIAELADMLRIEDKLGQPVRKLSLGERMKVELLCALLHRPDVLFLDEPTLGLDVNAQATIREFLKHYNQTHGATILLTSHYMADITALCERVILISGGELVFDGALDHLLSQHRPLREVRVETKEPVAPEALPDIQAEPHVDGRVITLQVKRDLLPTTISTLLTSLEVTDLSIADPPVEEVIGALFEDQQDADASKGDASELSDATSVSSERA